MCVNRIEYETISGARAHLSTASIFFAAPAGTRISRGADVRHSGTATQLHVLPFLPPNQQRQSTEGTAWLGVVGYYINLYSPKNGSNTKHRGTSINTNRAKTGNSFRRGRRCNGHPARMCRPSYYIELSAHRPLSASKSDREKQLPLRPLEI